MQNSLKIKIATFFVLLVGLAWGVAAEFPDLARLKVAAEAGDPVAQFEYAGRLPSSKGSEQIVWIRKSADQGYIVAEDALAAYLIDRLAGDSEKKKQVEREAVRWASRAAYRGLASAQVRMASFYASGVGLEKDSVAAYMWAQVAVQTAASENGQSFDQKLRANRDVLMGHLSKEKVLEGQGRAAAFVPLKYDQINPVEAELIFAELTLTVVQAALGDRYVVLNQTKFGPGETKTVKLNEQSIPLTCIAIAETSARFGITGTSYQTEIKLLVRR